jgi:hypothetical protein
MIGIGTPRSQSRMPRPMALSFQPAFPRMYIAHGRVWFPRAAGSLARSECRTEPRRTRRRTRGRVGIPRPAGFVRIFEPPGPVGLVGSFAFRRSLGFVRSADLPASLGSFGSSGSSGFQDRRVRSDVRAVGSGRPAGFVWIAPLAGPSAPRRRRLRWVRSLCWVSLHS